MTGRISWSVAHQPWIDVLDESGRPHLLSAAQAIDRADRVYLAAADPLLRAATVRLLLAFAYAAGCAPATFEQYLLHITTGLDLAPLQQWLRDHARELDVFCPERPLFQDASLRGIADVAEARLPVTRLDHSSATRRPILSDMRHALVPVAVPPVTAFRWLLLQQMWGAGGSLPISSTVYGPHSVHAHFASATGGMVWWPGGTVAEMLAWRLIPVDGGPGAAHWTYCPRGERGTASAPLSELDALTWHNRRALLLIESDGFVREVLFAQGWIRSKDSGHAALQPGGRDRVATKHGALLSTEAIGGATDIAPLIAPWWQASEGSWPHIVQAAAAVCGWAPDVTAAGMHLPVQSKIAFHTAIHLPARLLADPRAGAVAAAVMRFRYSIRKARTPRRSDLNIVLPPNLGCELLNQETYLNTDQATLDAALFEEARPQAGTDPAAYGVKIAALAKVARIPASPTAGSTTDTPEQTLSAEPGVATDRAAVPGPEAVEYAVDDDLLFTTADSPPDDVWEPGNADADNAGAADPASAFSRRLGGFASPHRRAVLSHLVNWMTVPDIASPAIPVVTAGLPEPSHYAALLTAGLFAIHRQTNSRARMYGTTPLPRLARALGSGTSRGPRNQSIRTTLDLVIRTREATALRGRLRTLVRYAADQDLTPNWAVLFSDLVAWDPSTRRHWAELFYTKAVLPQRHASQAPAVLATAKDPISR
ncbi:type I-E CRISPR-associated protein Cse1/CasA [Streptomyces sp. 8L]|uniref:type I-E CRISPR-associated protein Cse1/CasA n=1 Tax=Streptomyces sp. 8L TaxID=2877242 RepID=UPI001CD6DAD6|nr:type I-E CRISPR-associated protein Cse1/CasA [Streptomyces sp. 8L]MCA1222557.1 type I-E CRISPR-associated protein Cse1/CasA [Streptomyces sp. 8L]